MNEMAFGLKVAEHLSASTRQLDEDILRRLYSARARALELQCPKGLVARLTGNGLGLRLRQALFPQLRSVALAMALVGVFIIGDHWATLSRVEAVQQVDAALLIDDLPIEAYLDPEFRVWLARGSSS
ncbi:DUF3619 family protein [Rhodocyclaceae bacterium SMB388]